MRETEHVAVGGRNPHIRRYAIVPGCLHIWKRRLYFSIHNQATSPNRMTQHLLDAVWTSQRVKKTGLWEGLEKATGGGGER